jgi:hypothetical protein
MLKAVVDQGSLDVVREVVMYNRTWRKESHCFSHRTVLSGTKHRGKRVRGRTTGGRRDWSS